MIRKRTRRQGWSVVIVLGVAGALIGCADDSDQGADTAPGGDTVQTAVTEPTVDTEQSAVPTGDPSAECADYATYGDLGGTSISVYSPVVDPEDQTHIASYEAFEACTGATIEYEGSLELPVQLPVRVEAGTPPDIAFIPQPGLLSTLVATGAVVPLPSEVSDNVDRFFGEDWRAYGTVDGTL